MSEQEIKPGWGETRGGEVVLVTPRDSDNFFLVTHPKGFAYVIHKSGTNYIGAHEDDVIRNIPGPDWPELPEDEPSEPEAIAFRGPGFYESRTGNKYYFCRSGEGVMLLGTDDEEDSLLVVERSTQIMHRKNFPNDDIIRFIGPTMQVINAAENSNIEEFRQRMAEEIEHLRNDVMQLTSSLLIRVQDFGRVGE